MGFGLAQKLRAATNAFRRKSGIGNYWYWVNPEVLEKSIDILPLVYPLRYDIVIRKQYFCFYRDNRHDYNHDFDAYFLKAKEHVYYQWFTKVLIPRFRPELARNEKAINEAYEERLRKSARLYDSIEHNGFDGNYPILPYTAETVLKTHTGVITGAKYYMGDGCHRLACLLSLGYKTLPVEYVRIKCFRTLVPLDNTSMITPHIDIDWHNSGLGTPNTPPQQDG